MTTIWQHPSFLGMKSPKKLLLLGLGKGTTILLDNTINLSNIQIQFILVI